VDNTSWDLVQKLAPGAGFEPTRSCGQRILSPRRLPGESRIKAPSAVFVSTEPVICWDWRHGPQRVEGSGVAIWVAAIGGTSYRISGEGGYLLLLLLAGHSADAVLAFLAPADRPVNENSREASDVDCSDGSTLNLMATIYEVIRSEEGGEYDDKPSHDAEVSATDIRDDHFILQVHSMCRLSFGHGYEPLGSVGDCLVVPDENVGVWQRSAEGRRYLGLKELLPLPGG